MRAVLVITLFLLPIVAAPASAFSAKAEVSATDLSAQTKKPVKKAKKIKEKVEYMRAAPSK